MILQVCTASEQQLMCVNSHNTVSGQRHGVSRQISNQSNGLRRFAARWAIINSALNSTTNEQDDLNQRTNPSCKRATSCHASVYGNILLRQHLSPISVASAWHNRSSPATVPRPNAQPQCSAWPRHRPSCALVRLLPGCLSRSINTRDPPSSSADSDQTAETAGALINCSKRRSSHSDQAPVRPPPRAGRTTSRSFLEVDHLSGLWFPQRTLVISGLLSAGDTDVDADADAGFDVKPRIKKRLVSESERSSIPGLVEVHGLTEFKCKLIASYVTEYRSFLWTFFPHN